MTIECFIGSVGSGKTTRVKEYPKKHPNDPCVAFLPGQILRGAIGSARFANGVDGNAPRDCDNFVFAQFLQHLELARAVGAVVIVSDGWPRTALQASALVMWLHRTGGNVQVRAHHLLCCETEWERRLKGDRWMQDPEQESVDRQRYAQSIEDSLGSVSVLRSMGHPFVESVQVHGEVPTP